MLLKDGVAMWWVHVLDMIDTLFRVMFHYFDEFAEPKL